MRQLFRAIASLALVVSSAIAIQPSSAQTTLLPACYAGTCYPTRAAAEGAMRAAYPYGALLREEATWISGYSGNAAVNSIRYKVDPQAPVEIRPPSYRAGLWVPGLCAPSADPDLPDWCASEEESATGIIDMFLRPSAPRCHYEYQGFSGIHQAPYARVRPIGDNKGLIDFQAADGADYRKFNYTTWCEEWAPDPGPQPGTYEITKLQTFVCPVGFDPPYSVSPGGLAQVPNPFICLPIGTMPTIEVLVTQTQSCAANRNPCYPATGDKARVESDFEFGGLTFSRYYHSLRQVASQPAFAPGWTHTFSDLLTQEHGRWNYYTFSDTGYVELFEQVNGSGGQRWSSSQSSGRQIRLTPDGSILTDGSTDKYFNTAGRLTRVVSDNGEVDVALTYQNGTLSYATDRTGRRLAFLYADDRLSAMLLPDGGSVEYDFDTSGNLVSVAYPGGATKQYRYNESGLSNAGDPTSLTGLIAEGGHRYGSFTYGTNGKVTGSRLHKGDGTYVESTTLAYGAPGTVVVTTPSALALTYEISTNTLYPRVLSVSGPNGVTASSFGPSGAMTTIDALGVQTQMAYANGYLESIVEAAGTPVQRRTTYERSVDFRVTRAEVANAAGAYVSRSSSTFNARGQVLTELVENVSSPGSRTMTHTYCEDSGVAAGLCPIVGLRLSTDGPRTDISDITTYFYRAANDAGCATTGGTCKWRKGDLWKVTNPLSHVQEITAYDLAGRPTQMKDSNGVVTDLGYHVRGWLTSMKVRGSNNASEADDAITLVSYYPNGLVQQVTEPSGAIQSYTYDDAHRLTRITDNTGNRIDYTLDEASNVTSEQVHDSAGMLKRSMARTYNQLSQAIGISDAYGHTTQVAYDAVGNASRVTDAAGTVTQRTFDALRRLTRTVQDVGGIGASTQLALDALDRTVAVTDPKGLVTSYSYNGFGDPVQTVSPDTGTTVATFDQVGNVRTKTDARGIVSTYATDALGRVKSISYADSSQNVTYTYDSLPTICTTTERFPKGRLAMMADPSGTTQYCYDRLGNVTRKLQTTAGNPLQVRYAFNPAGRMTGMTYPDGTVVDYTLDGQGRKIGVGVTFTGSVRQVVTHSGAYLPFGDLSGWAYGDGRTLLRTFDLDYRPTSVIDAGSNGLRIGLSYSDVGLVDGLYRGLPSGAPAVVLTHDSMGRLSHVQDQAATGAYEAYEYDQTGDRTAASTAATSSILQYATDSHRLSSVDGVLQTYDVAGNLVSRGVQGESFVFNAGGRLAGVVNSVDSPIQYSYNGLAERVNKRSGASSTLSTFADGNRWIGDFSSATNLIQAAIWMDSMPVGLVDVSDGATAMLFLEPDHLGTPRVARSYASNTQAWRLELDSEAFGASNPSSPADPSGESLRLDMRFPGQRYDESTGFSQNGFRDYDARIGRYIESDPIGLDGGISTYAYADSRPHSLSDPLGLETPQYSNNQYPSQHYATPCQDRALMKFLVDLTPLTAVAQLVKDVSGLEVKFGGTSVVKFELFKYEYSGTGAAAAGYMADGVASIAFDGHAANMARKAYDPSIRYQLRNAAANRLEKTLLRRSIVKGVGKAAGPVGAWYEMNEGFKECLCQQ